MKRYGVTLDQLLNACENSNTNAAGSYLIQNGQEYLVRGTARTADAEELGNVVIADHEGETVRIADVARITLGSSDRMHR
jgi:Cu/Ag efflux pump CusA